MKKIDINDIEMIVILYHNNYAKMILTVGIKIIFLRKWYNRHIVWEKLKNEKFTEIFTVWP